MSIISREKPPSEKIFRENWNSEMQSQIPFFGLEADTKRRPLGVRILSCKCRSFEKQRFPFAKKKWRISCFAEWTHLRVTFYEIQINSEAR